MSATQLKTQAIADNAISTPKIGDGQITQPKLASGVGGNTDHSFRLLKGSLQSIPNNTFTIVTFEGSGEGRFDTDGLHSDSPNPSRITFTAATAGKWLITGLLMLPDSTSERHVTLLKSGTNIAAAGTHIASGINQGTCVTTIINLAAGDYIEMSAFQTSGGTLMIDGVPKGRTLICGIRIAT